MLIVGGQVPEQDVLLVFKVLQGNLNACFPAGSAYGPGDRRSAYTGSGPVYKVVSEQFCFYDYPFWLSKVSTWMTNFYPIDSPRGVPLGTSHCLPKGPALWVSLKGFVTSVPILDTHQRTLLLLGQEEWQKEPFGHVFLSLSHNHVLERRDFSSSEQGNRDGESGGWGSPLGGPVSMVGVCEKAAFSCQTWKLPVLISYSPHQALNWGLMICSVRAGFDSSPAFRRIHDSKQASHVEPHFPYLKNADNNLQPGRGLEIMCVNSEHFIGNPYLVTVNIIILITPILQNEV